MHNNEISRSFSVIFTFLNRIMPFLFWVLIIFSFDDTASATVTIIAALIHEAGHFSFYFFRSKKLPKARSAINGFRIRKPAIVSYKDEIIVCLLGPLFNIAAAAAILPFRFLFGEYADLFSVLNLATALSNLLPVEGYDGYRILSSLLLLSKRLGGFVRVLRAASSVLIAVFVFLSIYLMERFGSGYWIFAVFSVSLISSTSKRLKTQNARFSEF